ncbi:MAG: DUF1419 domain-containing protein [Gemmataceae bacterium]|nr:DUF1419 domain-containing protein [Gemmataceae bacterium]
MTATADPAGVERTLATLGASPILFRPPGDEPWADLMARISTPGRAAEVTPETYDHFLNVLPPRWMGEGFMFAEGAEALRYFWRSGRRCYCRQTTWNETLIFCAAAGVPTPN